MADVRITDAPASPDFVRFRADFGQKFLLTVDTEEEFAWEGPFTREHHSLDTVTALAKFLQFCEGLNVKPVFLVDYPVATSHIASDVLKDAVQAGRAEIGVHLHPWVNPPYEEEISEFNSYAGNLPAELERTKFLRLRDAVEANFGLAPRIYRAGRYGAGPHTAAMLGEGGIAIDTSVRSYFDYSSSGGPNYRDHPVRPYWLDRKSGLLELPVTSVYWGLLHQLGPWLYPRFWRIPQFRGLLARLGMLDRIPLTPEGISVAEAINGIDIALDTGLPVLVFSFHSPSLGLGYTPYVSNEDELDAFYDWWRTIIAHLTRRGVAPTSVAEIMASVELA